MEDFRSVSFDAFKNATRKRSQTSRRPRPDPQVVAESRSSLSTTPISDEASKVSSDENTGCAPNSKRKEFNLNQCVSRVSSASGSEGEKPHKKIRKENGGPDALYNREPGHSRYDNKRSSEGVLAPANWKSSSNVKESAGVYVGGNIESESLGQSALELDESGSDNKVKKVKLKVGCTTRTIHANSTSNGASEGRSSARISRSSDIHRPRRKLHLQENSDDDDFPPSKKGGLQGIPWKNFSKGGFSIVKDDSSTGRISGKNPTRKQGNKSEVGRKSKQGPKKRAANGAFDEDEEDDEIRYLEKLKTSKVSAAGYEGDNGESVKKWQKLARISDIENSGASRPGKDGKKKSQPDRVAEDTDYEEEEQISDCELEGKKRKKPRKESVDSPVDGRGEFTLTTRQRALQTSKGAAPGTSVIEFPNGLPPAAPKKQKEKLTEVEQQLRKAEAAQRRRVQVEKAARESEAEAIRKILGQDSTRKKREDKIKKRQEELKQEKAANALTLASNTIRCVMGPTGTVLTFSNDMGLPSIFQSNNCSYPPPRENCAGPSCTNPYKYRDSKSKLPLCSLQCYKAVQGKMKAES